MNGIYPRQRIHYIDVCKGTLILIVILHHIFGLMREYGYLSQDTKYLEKIYVPFFMASFFVVTGFCGNFNKEFKPFLIKNIKSLMIPGVCFFIMLRTTELAVDLNVNFLSICKVFVKLLFKGGPWFLVSLFISKILIWFVQNKIKHKPAQLGVGCLCLIIASIAKTCNVPELWSLYHALGMAVFLLIGIMMRNVVINRWIFICSLLIYIIYITTLIFYELHLPRITSRFSLYPYETPFFIIGAVSGTWIIWYICKFINKNIILEYLGKNSLIIYLTHWVIIKSIIIYSQRYCWDVGLSNSTIFGLLFVFTLSICLILVHVFKLKKLRWMLGKA